MSSYGSPPDYQPSKVSHWCPVCDGFGGWDKGTNKVRFREGWDTQATYLPCLWCGVGNVVRKVVTDGR